MTTTVSGSGPVAKSVAEALERISLMNASLNAFITVFEAEAMAQARALDEELRHGHSRGPAHGWIVSIKDLIDMAGVPTTAASRSRRTHVASADATIVTRLRQSGAIIIGKCNLHEFALGTTSDESAFGPVHNPRDIHRSPGGSSGGSAAAVAAGLGRASIGSDTGGSIRIPAAACGVVGLKPAFGEVPTAGLVPLSVSLDHVGPIANNVSDAWVLYGVLKGNVEVPSDRAAPPPSQITVGRLGGYFSDLLDPDVAREFDAAIDRLADAGVTVREVRIPGASAIAQTYSSIVLPEAFAVHAKALERDADGYSVGVRQRLAAGRDIPAGDYVDAQRVRGTLRAAVDAALGHCDAIVLPTLPIPAPVIGAETVEIGGLAHMVRPLMLRLTQLFNLSGHPAISIPCGSTSEGLPCGLQLVGRRDNTRGLLAIALTCEGMGSDPGKIHFV